MEPFPTLDELLKKLLPNPADIAARLEEAAARHRASGRAPLTRAEADALADQAVCAALAKLRGAS